ncbi:DUF5134 domain-containing protein [Nocardia sp. CDC186]|uniref:DUF5134 domain-containing protein n=1 Tax=Nocardia implantans TaxID=3108168 RepID=A0ABU6B0B1_9NOCA|nr:MULTISPECIES: DUF5134 domain-containing protein [unclassified Nocardia]MBF6195291.1 DUF5134 domain-containing protein [Nocardia beijingensis]MEA3530663.1 DUF5134 domain-containing protein [Nocardia sp. CDC192]MEB3513207.1 DUF5134 domain-containing protein [Nocardia sp. CDC186]
MHHTGLPPAATWGMIVLCCCGAAVAAVGLLRPRRAPGRLARYGERGSELFHAVMLAAMAAMWSAVSANLSVLEWRLLFGALAIASPLWLVVVAARERSAERADRIGAAVYHGVAALAMVYATLGTHASPPEHVHHATAHAPGLPYPVIGWILAAMFLLDALVVVAVVVRPPGEAPPTRHEIAVTVFPHLVMDIATAVMLVAALDPAELAAASAGR